MTREEAIFYIKELQKTYASMDKKVAEAVDMAIEALSAKPTDLISRADAIEAVADEWLSEASAESPYVNDDDIGEYKKLAEKLFEDIPSADRPTGEWIPCSERMPSKDGCYLVTTTGTNNDIIDIAYYTEEIWHKASRIKAWMPLPKPYCPNCGADMRGEKNE